MSYYMMGIQFWSEVSLFFALLPLLAVATNAIIRAVSRTPTPEGASGALDPHRRGVLGVFCRVSSARWG
jgi:hypothetical protein